MDGGAVGATLQVPVTTDGKPPAIAFEPKYPAGALQIGAILRLVDAINPGVATDFSGNFCVFVSLRFIEETGKEDAPSEKPTTAMVA